MSTDYLEIRDKILHAALPSVVFDGWGWDLLETAAVQAGYEKSMARAVFPDGIPDALAHFADMMDRAMLARLKKDVANIEDLRIRDRVRTAVLARFDALRPHKAAEKLALRYWSMPLRSIQGGKILWRTADHIWNWAGDTATDYNRYTKRGLLSGVLAATLLTWIDDDTADMSVTSAFLDRRIENVMQVGRITSKLKKKA